MSCRDLQEHSFVKVLYDFQYKTAEGREIVITKDEKLYLLQKTNADWWQVVRTWEQRSFYVPATYVREMSRTSRKISEEDKDPPVEPLDGPKYKNMPKETSSAMRNVKKWLANAIESKHEAIKVQNIPDESHKHNAMDYAARAELKVGLAAIKTKSLERDHDQIDRNDNTRSRKQSTETQRKLLSSGTVDQNNAKANKYFSTSPKSFDTQSRVEMSMQDPFRKELESSLDRLRKKSDNTTDKLIRLTREQELYHEDRARTKSCSDDSHVDSEADEHFQSRVSQAAKKIDKTESKHILSTREESISGRLSPNNPPSRNSRSLDSSIRQIGKRTERSLSPKPSYGRQLTIAEGEITDEELDQNTSGNHKILNDKRRTWAVEELMSELTQMCKERGHNKKTNFQLKSTEMKSTFDPLDELTRELHEMNLLRSGGNTPQTETQPMDIKSANISPSNIYKISIKSDKKKPEFNVVSQSVEKDNEPGHVTEHSNISETADTLEKSSMYRHLKSGKKPVFEFQTSEIVLPQTKPAKSPKSPKILDEYNEANILNDCSPHDALGNPGILKHDKQSHLKRIATETSHSSSDTSHESPSYSSIKLQQMDKVKMRPKIQLKFENSPGELKLTPSLEKLASEIQFLPANRASYVCDDKKAILNECVSDGDTYDDSRKHDGTHKYDDCWGRKATPTFIKYAGSFKTKREGRYFHRRENSDQNDIEDEFDDDEDDDDEDDDDEDNDDDDDACDTEPIVNASTCGLKKSSTLHYITVPDNYRRFRTYDDLASIRSKSLKRQSRSLSDLRCFEGGTIIEKTHDSPKFTKSKPVPLPRTKIPAIEPINPHANIYTDGVTINVERSRVPVPRKTTPEKKLETFPNDSGRDKLDKYSNKSMNQMIPGSEVNIESSTAVGFKTLLCTSESGSDNCLQSKDLLSPNSEYTNDDSANRIQGKLAASVATTKKDVTKTRESPSEDQVLSSNASSEALQSQSESDITATFDASSQPSPVNARLAAQDPYHRTVDLPPGWTQNYDLHTDQICFINKHGDRVTMNNEYCLMEEKSLLAYTRAVEGICLGTDDGLSSFSKAKVPSYSWLPDELRKKIAQSCKDIRTRQGYPVVDWLKQIRNNCDYCDSEITSQSLDNLVDFSEKDDISYIDSIGEPNHSDCYITHNMGSFKIEVTAGELSDLKENTKDKFHDPIAISVADKYKREHIECTHIGDALHSDNENVDTYDRTTESISREPQEIKDSHTVFLADVAMQSRSLRCCVDLIQDESGYFTPFQAKTFGDRIDINLIINNDDNSALNECHRFLEESKIYRTISDCKLDMTNEMAENFMLSTETVSQSDYIIHGRTTECYVHKDTAVTNCDKMIDMNYENDSSIAHMTENSNMTLLSGSTAAKHWSENYNNFNSCQEEDILVTSNELLYDSCENFYNNIYSENSYGSKICDSDYKSIGSEGSNFAESLQDIDEETTSFEKFFPPIYENWNICVRSGCSSQSLDDTRASEFYSPNEFNDTMYDDVGVVQCAVDESRKIHEFRKRKGSTASDVLMWKKNLLYQAIDDEDDLRQWFSSNDDEGKIYFFEENSNESSWVLPTIRPDKSPIKTRGYGDEDDSSNATNEFSQPQVTSSSISITNQSISPNVPTKKLGASPNDWPQLSFDGNMRLLREGPISRTKITENGKKLRKNWSTSYAVLTELFLLFFKDSKTFSTMMKSGQSPIAKPDISVDLNGALVEPGETASSRKNVYKISTVLGLQVLIQSDNTALAAEWFQEIHGAIRKLPFGFKSQTKPFAGPPEIRRMTNSKSSTETSHTEESKKASKVARSRSMKMKRLDDSLEDLSGTVAERQTKIKAKLRRFFLRRPTVESLMKNGIYKDEPAFGSYLKDVCPTEYPRVPLFVKTCIEVLESNDDNMKTDGLYRASGNLSQIQKIRLQVDQYNLNVLSQEEDVHVLTGALKLFFRELKEPLIPSSFFEEALNASMLKKNSAKVQCFREIIKALPPPNHDTLQFLLKHLLKVTSYQEYNRMHIPNLAIVFGPTLMWPAEESANMALDLMQQNLVIECLLSEYNKIFK